MAAEEHLGPQFFHGSPADLEPGQMLTPRTGHVYFAGNKQEPASGNYGGNVYQVEPTGSYEPDPALAHIPELESLRSQHPVKVIKKV